MQYAAGTEQRVFLHVDAQRASRVGRPIVFSICEWGSTKPWLWAGPIGNLGDQPETFKIVGTARKTGAEMAWCRFSIS